MKRKFCDTSLSLALCISLFLTASCHTSRKSGSDFYRQQIEQLASDLKKDGKHHPKSSKVRKKIVDEAYTWLGTPYCYSKAEKGVATDCSGMVLEVYGKVTGVKLPRNSARQAEFCKSIRPDDVAIGDLVFFATGRDKDVISHVGIMVDDRNFIHASASKGVVVSDVTQPYYIRTFRGFGRVDF